MIQDLFPPSTRVNRIVPKRTFIDKLEAIISGREERYQFTWPDKKKAILLANSPVNAALRPCREESVNFDSTATNFGQIFKTYSPDTVTKIL